MKSLTWIVGLLALILLSKQITATTVYIATTGSDITGTGTAGSPYASLSWAVSQAQNVANPDVTVLVGNGTYSGVANAGILLTYGSLTLQPNPANTEQTTFNIKSISTFFVQATNAQVTVSDITIRGGSALSGGQISVTSGRLVASNVFFENSTAATAGGAVLLNNSYGSSFSHCTFVASYTRNTASTGGQVALFNTDAVFSACSFIGGVAEQGGAVYLTNSLSTNNAPSFVQCTFVSNSAQLLLNSRASSVNGGAITVGTLPTNQTVVISDSTFDANSAPSDSGGSIYIYPLSAVSIDTSVFINGQAAIGGAIYSEKGSIVVTNTQFTNLTAQHTADGSSGKGGAIYIHAGYLTAINTSFSNNTAAENGGALAHNGGANHLTEADANDQTQLLGCVFSGNVAALNGGAIYLSNLVNPVNITTTNFISNRANAAGQFVGGGAILASGVHLEVNGLCSFEGNTAVASMGGAIYYEVLAGTPAPNSTNPLSVISGAHFTNNLAAVGGALCVDGLGDNQNGLYITGSRFAQNSANSFNTLKGQGGAIMGYNTTTVVSNSVFYDNRASDQGGALWFGGEIPSSPHCLDCAFFGNVVANQGTGTNAFLTGQTDSVFVGSNETLDQEGVQFVVSGSGASLTVSVSNSEPDANCYFTAITVTKNASLFLNCTATIKSLNFDLGLVTLQTSAFLNLIDFSWSGGVFSCPAHGVITLQASVKGGAYITNDGAKALNNCNFVNNGNTRFTNFPGGQLVDLQLMADSQLFNFNFISFAGHVVLNNEGNTPIMFENQGTLSIESTLALTTRSANFDLAMVGNKKNKLLGLYIHLINLNSTFTIGNQIAHKSTDWTQYTALDVASTFNANGALQIIFPDHWTGTWSNLIAFRSITGSFTALRSQSYRKNHYVGHRTKQIINSNSISIKIADSSNDLTGGQIFGIIFGTFAIVAVIALVVWYFYRKRGDQETYERLDRPAYGTV